METKNKISFKKYILIGTPVIIVLGVVVGVLKAHSIDPQVSLVDVIAVFTVLYLTEFLARRLDKNHKA